MSRFGGGGRGGGGGGAGGRGRRVQTSTLSAPVRRRRPVGFVVLGLIAVIVAGAVVAAIAIDRTPGAARAASAQAPIGIVNAIGSEQAAILSIMHVDGTVTLDGYRFYSGTIDGHPAGDVAGGELAQSAELARARISQHDIAAGIGERREGTPLG
jgi:hypothetical protein